MKNKTRKSSTSLMYRFFQIQCFIWLSARPWHIKYWIMDHIRMLKNQDYKRWYKEVHGNGNNKKTRS